MKNELRGLKAAAAVSRRPPPPAVPWSGRAPGPNPAGGGPAALAAIPGELLCPQVRPLWTVGGASAWLKIQQEEITRLVEEGWLEWAWDIGRSGANRREVRIWFHSLETFKRQRARPLAERAGRTPWSPETVVRAIIGHGRPTLRGTEIQALLNCSIVQVGRLLAAGELIAVRSAPAPAVVSRSPIVLSASLKEFLLRRRIC